MKKILFITLLICNSLTAKVLAQERILGEINYGLLEKYIQSAKNHYLQKKILDKQAESIKTNIAINTVSYLDIFNASYIYRPDNNTAIVAPGLNNNPYLVNGYQFGVNINVGSFLQKPFQVKKAKLDYEVAQLRSQEYSKTLEAEVKTRYYNYIQQVAQMKLSAQNLQDISLISEGVRRRFERTEVSMEVYDQSRVSLTNARMQQLAVEVNLQKAKDALEEIIGVPLSDIR
jgi:outer membrane protein TolC